MELYRGMNSLEWNEWKAASAMPSSKNFTTNAQEALYLGRKYCLQGKVFVLAVQYDDLLFRETIAMRESTWYESMKPISLNEVIYSTLTTTQLKQTIL